jgi:hypothetical protein
MDKTTVTVSLLHHCQETLFFASYTQFPATGNVDTLYVDKSTSNVYSWTGSAYTMINPTGIPPELADSAPQTIRMDCDAGAVVGDLVRLHATLTNTVEVATNNLIARPVIGVIKSKISSTYCVVYLSGVIDRTVAIGKLYLSPAGDFTATPPTSDYLQILGYSYGNGKIHLEPNLSVVKLT